MVVSWLILLFTECPRQCTERSKFFEQDLDTLKRKEYSSVPLEEVWENVIFIKYVLNMGPYQAHMSSCVQPLNPVTLKRVLC